MGNRNVTSALVTSMWGLGFAVAASSWSCAHGGGNGGSFDSGGAVQDAGPASLGEGSAPSACLAASQAESAVGCEYYAVDMDGKFAADNGCFVAFVVNTAEQAAHIGVAFDGAPIDLATYAKLPRGFGQAMAYDAFNPDVGLAPGQVAILFLAGLPGAATPTPGDWTHPVACPVAPARSTLAQVHGTGVGRAFHITTDNPVVAYQMLPYGGGSAAVTGATLLLPTSVYGSNYVAVNAYPGGPTTPTSMDLVASVDGTHVTLLPKVAIAPGGGVRGAPAGAPATYTLNAGEVLQLTQPAELTGSPIQSDQPVGLFAGHPCVDVPVGANYCDHAEQQIPPVSALGSEYAAASYRARTPAPESPPWRIVGVVDGTQLTYEPNVGGPASVNLSDVVEFRTGTPFVVRSQDASHPFLLVTYMTGATTVGGQGYGDADFVRVVPAAQYLSRYVFFTDPTYPETNLVVTRTRGAAGFADVSLDCAGTLTGWAPLGTSGSYEVTRVDLVRHDFQPQGGCNNGRREMTSAGNFGVTVWGWGTPETSIFTQYVSYGYPAGESVAPLSSVVVPTQ